MADPLSISASVLAVLSAGISVSKAINTAIQGYREAPVAITALSNEVSDLIVVLQEVRDRNLDDAAGGSLAAVLSRADEKLEELRGFVRGLGVLDGVGGVGGWRRSYERARWVERKKTALELKCGLRDVKGDLVLLLSSGILSQVKSTEAVMEAISQKIEVTTVKDEKHQNETSTRLVNHGHRVSELIAEVKRTGTNVEAVSRKLEATALRDERHHNEVSTHLISYSHRLSEVVDPIQKMVEEQQNQRQMLQLALAACDQSSTSPPTMTGHGSQTVFGSKITVVNREICSKWCSCVCHRHIKIRSPRFLDPMFGALFFGYSGIPVLTPSCNESSCWGRSCQKTSLTYYFPNWLLDRVLSVVILNSLEPTASLKIPRLIDSEAKVWRLVKGGDVENMKYLFRNGLSSPNDLNEQNGRSLLLFAFIFGQVEMSEFLLEAGADPYIEDFHGRNAAEYAQGLIIRNGYQIYGTPWGSTGALSQLARRFSLDYSVAQRRQFSRLHKAVVQDNAQKLRQELELSTKDIDGQDTDGLTPLHLAVYRANAESVELLLACGADLGTRDKHGFYILEKLLWQRYEDETELLRQDRCLQSIISHYGWKKCGKILASHGYPEYHSVLDQACWANRHTAVAMLLAAGAQIRDPDDRGRSALDTCVRCNQHESLELILGERKQLEKLTKGAWLRMLDFTKDRSDARTVNILTKAELVIDRLDAEDWERLATIPSASHWRYGRGFIEEFRRWKPLYKELIKGLRLRAGFDPVLSPLAWSDGEAEWEEDELGEEDGDDEFEDESETDEEKDSEQEDEEFEDAVEYHEG